MKRFIVVIFLLVFGLWVPTVQADIGKKITDTIVEIGRETISEGPSSALSHVVMKAMKQVLDEVKEQVKDEARVYARKLGDTVSERLMEHKRVKKFVNTVKVACWAITIYLVLVTLLLLLSLRKLYVNDRIILRLLNEIKRREGEGA